ncbi:alpha/beta fold hydrolase [Aquitalea sp. S1-19]|nr:alpha/beta fold hydrolase [Aquitalea sp. S1-19]
MNIPSSLLLLLLAELALDSALIHHLADTSLMHTLLLALLAMLALRMLTMAFIWGFSRLYGSPAAPLGLMRWLNMLLHEYLAYVFTFSLLLPFEKLWMRADRLRPCRRVVLLVHGYGCSRGVWWKIRRELEAAGHVVATLSLTPPLASIDTLETQLDQRIREVCAATGAPSVHLVGHSMGGLVSRAYLKRHGAGRVTQLITLASPHRGSELARLGMGENARQMQPHSPWLDALGETLPAIAAISVRTSHDNFVTPQDRQRLNGAVDIEMPATGHLALLYTRQTSTLLCQLLAGKISPASTDDSAEHRHRLA